MHAIHDQPPPAPPGLRIGLFGGSFNPPHEGHLLVARQCLRRLALDRVWILVSPGNPLKDHSELAPLAERAAATARLMDDPRIDVTTFEAAHGFHYTFQTLSHLVAARSGARFVWIMGADSLMSFDHWERWQDIARLLPMAVYARPGTGPEIVHARAAQVLADARLPEEQAETLALRAPPAWVYLHGLMSPQSSTAIRAARKAGAAGD